MSDTLVTFVLDRTGSMNLIKAATIESFNAYLAELRKSDDVKFSLITFDTMGIDKVHFEADPKLVPDLTDASYQPRMGTNLIDASCITIHALEKALAAKDSKPKVVVCIQTDGEENASHLHTWEELRGLIDQKQKEGWQFNFMGAGIDAYQQASRMGIAAASTMSYDSSDLAKSRAAFTMSAGNTRSFAAGLSANTSYSLGQKQAAGDAFDPLLKTTGFAAFGTAAPSNPLDLTSAPVTKKSPTDLDLTSTS